MIHPGSQGLAWVRAVPSPPVLGLTKALEVAAPAPGRVDMVKNKVQLITYPDSLGGDLRALHHILRTYLPGLFAGGIHILPPYPSSADRGYAPLTYLDIDPAC